MTRMFASLLSGDLFIQVIQMPKVYPKLQDSRFITYCDLEFDSKIYIPLRTFLLILRACTKNVTLGLKKHSVLIHNKNINKIGIRANRIIPSLNLLIFIIKSRLMSQN